MATFTGAMGCGASITTDWMMSEENCQVVLVTYAGKAVIKLEMVASGVKHKTINQCYVFVKILNVEMRIKAPEFNQLVSLSFYIVMLIIVLDKSPHPPCLYQGKVLNCREII